MRGFALAIALAACSLPPQNLSPSPDPSPPPPDAGAPPPYLGVNIVSWTAWPIQGMAVDDTTLYWMAAGTLRAIPKDGGVWRTIAAGESPASNLALSNGFVWWLTPVDIRRAPISGGQVDIVAKAIAARPALFTALGNHAFYVDAGTNHLLNDLGDVIASADGAPWGLAASTDTLLFACDNSIQSIAPDGSSSARIAAFTTTHRRYDLAVSPMGAVYVEEVDKTYGAPSQLNLVGGIGTTIPGPVFGLAASASGAYFFATAPQPRKPPCGLFDPGCTPFDFDLAVHNGIFHATLAGTFAKLADVPYDLEGIAADDGHVYFGRAPTLLSEAEIDRIP